MTTTTDRPATTRPLDRFVTAMCGDEPTINDVASVLQLLGTADDIDPARLPAICLAAARALGKFDAETRWAPPSALAEMVVESSKPCINPMCGERVPPWADSAHGSPDCVRQAHRLGEV